MTKELIFDMDGTIADLYGYPDWLVKLRSEDVSPYVEASPMYDMDTMVTLLNILKTLGFKIAVVSWSSKEGTKEYNRQTKMAKQQWLDTFGFPYDRLHVIKYGTPKANYIREDLSVLLDDNAEVRKAFCSSKRGKYKKAIDVTKESIISFLVDLIIREAEGGIKND